MVDRAYVGGCWHKKIEPILSESGTYQPGMCRDCHALIDMRTGKRMTALDVQNWCIENVAARLDGTKTSITGG